MLLRRTNQVGKLDNIQKKHKGMKDAGKGVSDEEKESEKEA